MSEDLIKQIGEELNGLIVNKTLELPMLPQVTTKVLSLVNDVDSDAQALAQLIQSDQALAGHVMRIANSAAYSPTSKMSTLQQAIARLGMAIIGEIALASTMGPKLFEAPGFEKTIKLIWTASLATGVWSREIARQLRRHVEISFLCGLLCQIGKPVVLQTALKLASKKSKELDADSVQILMTEYQSVVGKALAEHWQLPLAVQQTIECMDGALHESSTQEIVETVKAAQVFAEQTVTGRSYDAQKLCADPRAIAADLYADDVQELLDKTDTIHQTIEALSL